MAGAEKNSLSIFSLLDALSRRKFAIVIPVVLLTTGFNIYACLQPNRYGAAAGIAAAQTTPPEYLKHVAPPPLRLEDHLWTVREVLYSDPVLQTAAKEMKQYQGGTSDLSPQQLEELKQRITLKIDSDHTLQLIYDAGDSYDEMNVAHKLADAF